MLGELKWGPLYQAHCERGEVPAALFNFSFKPQELCMKRLLPRLLAFAVIGGGGGYLLTTEPALAQDTRCECTNCYGGKCEGECCIIKDCECTCELAGCKPDP